MDEELKSLYEELKSLYDKFQQEEVELKDLIVIAKQIEYKEFQGLNYDLKKEISIDLQKREVPSLSDASWFLYNIDDMGKKIE